MHQLDFKKLTGVIVLCLIFNITFCQTTKKLTINFKAVFGENNLVLNDSTYNLDGKNTIKLESIKFYFSNIQLLQAGKVVFMEKNSFHLYTSDCVTKIISLTIPSKIQFDGIKFCLGIDSLTNVSGVFGGDLDPSNGMYWTWQSGYINFKLEAKSTLSTHQKNEVQLHLGGYAEPLKTLQSITLAVINKSKIDVLFDIKQFVNGFDLSKQHHIMSPKTEAIVLSKLASSCFKIE